MLKPFKKIAKKTSKGLSDLKKKLKSNSPYYYPKPIQPFPPPKPVLPPKNIPYKKSPPPKPSLPPKNYQVKKVLHLNLYYLLKNCQVNNWLKNLL